MKTSHIVFVIAIVAIIALLAWPHKKIAISPTTNQPSDTIVGCYTATTGKDLYTLHIKNQDASLVSGSLAFKNFEKDSSTGTFAGSYTDGVLFGNYTFASEGTTSVMQVIFKKQGSDFVRGYGDVNADGTKFTDLSKITYDSSTLSVFKSGPCAESPVFAWSYKKATSLNPDGMPNTDVFLTVNYGNGVTQTKLIDTTPGSCNDLPDRDADSVPNSTNIQCYAAGLGYRFKITKGSLAYLVQRKEFEEGTPESKPTTQKYQVVAEIPFSN